MIIFKIIGKEMGAGNGC